jgi:SHS2 domain-containing protein
MAVTGDAPAFEILEHTADIGLRARGESLEELFENAAWGLAEILDRGRPPSGEELPADWARGPHREGKDFPVVMTDVDLGALLVEFLDEVLFVLQLDPGDRCLMAVRVFDVGSTKLDGRDAYRAEWIVRTSDCPSSPDGTELKGTTFHQLVVERSKGGWQATVYFDV